MRALTQARAALEAGVQAALAPLPALEARGRTLAAQLQQLGARISADSTSLSQRGSSRQTQLDAKLARSRTLVAARSAGASAAQRALTLGTLDAIERETRTLASSVAQAEDSLRTLTSGLIAAMGAASEQLSTALAALKKNILAQIARVESPSTPRSMPSRARRIRSSMDCAPSSGQVAYCRPRSPCLTSPATARTARSPSTAPS
jgi:hypothetical protein